MLSRLYRGYSSHQFPLNKTFELYDIDLVKMDLLNHIYTRKGERVMMPTFGTIIPELIFEPLDESTVSILRDEIKSVIDFDPRVRLLNLNISPDFENHVVIASALLLYVELNMQDVLELNITFEG